MVDFIAAYVDYSKMAVPVSVTDARTYPPRLAAAFTQSVDCERGGSLGPPHRMRVLRVTCCDSQSMISHISSLKY